MKKQADHSFPKISAAIITFNEERNILRCLESLRGIADEILVLDSGSTDRTREICESFGVRFVVHPFDGHIQQKNRALGLCTHDWVFSLDADEALSEELKESVRRERHHLTGTGYRMNRLTNYCGSWVHHCGWYPDTKTRFVNRHFARWTGVNPHDRLELTDGSMPKALHGDILHYSYYTQEDHLRQIEYFSEIASGELYQRRIKARLWLIPFRVIAQFIKSYFLKRGFLDGFTGFTISRLSAFATYRKYYKLYMRWNEGK